MAAHKSNVPYNEISRTSVSTQGMFNKCCLCVPLKTGCFILGYLNLVVSCFQTLVLIGLTVSVGIISHGFDHFDKPHGDPLSGPSFNISLLNRPTLLQVCFILAVLLTANVSWLVVNVACLVGLHKRKPGPIRVYVGFATARLVLGLASFVVALHRLDPQIIVTHCIDMGLTTYFITVYYAYANRLERERKSKIAAPAPSPINIVYIYPTKLDESHLVTEEKKGAIEA